MKMKCVLHTDKRAMVINGKVLHRDHSPCESKSVSLGDHTFLAEKLNEKRAVTPSHQLQAVTIEGAKKAQRKGAKA